MERLTVSHPVTETRLGYHRTWGPMAGDAPAAQERDTVVDRVPRGAQRLPPRR